MEHTDHFHLGYISKTAGKENLLVVQLDSDDPKRYSRIDALFVDLGGTLTPFFVSSARFSPPAAIVVELEDVDGDLARQLVGNDVYLPLAALPKLSGKKFYFHEVIGYEVVDKTKGSIGIIESSFDRSTQPVLMVMQGKTEILIPVTDDFIVSVDRDNKILNLDLPEGLIDLYLRTDDEDSEFT